MEKHFTICSDWKRGFCLPNIYPFNWSECGGKSPLSVGQNSWWLSQYICSLVSKGSQTCPQWCWASIQMSKATKHSSDFLSLCTCVCGTFHTRCCLKMIMFMHYFPIQITRLLKAGDFFFSKLFFTSWRFKMRGGRWVCSDKGALERDRAKREWKIVLPPLIPPPCICSTPEFQGSPWLLGLGFPMHLNVARLILMGDMQV